MSDFRRLIAKRLSEGHTIPELVDDPDLVSLSRATIYRYANETQTGLSKARISQIYDDLDLRYPGNGHAIFTPLRTVAAAVAEQVPCSPDLPRFWALFHPVADVRLRQHIRHTQDFINSRKTAKGLGPEGKKYYLSKVANACCLKDWPGDKSDSLAVI